MTYRAEARSAGAEYLFGPWADVMLLGGGSIVGFALLRGLGLHGPALAQLAVAMLVLANLVNHPHFAHSYQLFYGTWAEMKCEGSPVALRRRWWFTGVAAPGLLGLALLVGASLWLRGNTQMLALMVNLMATLVGWHYVKQGFGMAMMDAALKKRFWAASARKALLANAYACWIAAWTMANGSSFGSFLWGISSIKLAVPDSVIAVACGIAALTTVWAGLEIFRSISGWKAQELKWHQWPLAGCLAYVITLYLWTLFSSIDPAFVLVVPFFHSLQYLTVVWRYKLNEQAQEPSATRRLIQFAAVGLIVGVLGFWLVPGLLDYVRTGVVPDPTTQGVALGLACLWLFINVHHYLIDSVLWRQGNPKVGKHLFGVS